MRKRDHARFPVTVVGALAGLLVLAGGCKRNELHWKPGESGDAAAAGSNYGVGRPGVDPERPGADRPSQGVSRVANPDPGRRGGDAGTPAAPSAAGTPAAQRPDGGDMRRDPAERKLGKSQKR